VFCGEFFGGLDPVSQIWCGTQFDDLDYVNSSIDFFCGLEPGIINFFVGVIWGSQITR